MSGPWGAPYGVRVPVPAEPAIVRVQIPGPMGPAGPAGSAIDVLGTASTALSGHMAVYALPDGALAYASADTPETVDTFVGVTVAAVAGGAEVAVRALGEMVEPSWSWTPGPIYLGLAGALTQDEPAIGVVLVIATALSATRILIDPDQPVFLGA